MNQETEINIRWKTGKLYLNDTVVGIVYAEAGGHTAIFHYPPIPDMQSPKVRNRLIKNKTDARPVSFRIQSDTRRNVMNRLRDRAIAFYESREKAQSGYAYSGFNDIDRMF